ncbi:unnamed protein product [Arctogadus glacialis]
MTVCVVPVTCLPEAETHIGKQGLAKMVSDGQTLGSSRSRWSFPNLAKMFWGIVEFVGLFFTTIVQSDLTKDKIVAGSSRFSDGRDPPGPPGGRRRMGRINHGAGPSAPPMGGGG